MGQREKKDRGRRRRIRKALWRDLWLASGWGDLRKFYAYEHLGKMSVRLQRGTP